MRSISKIFLLLVALSNFATAQRYGFVNYNVDQGMPQSTVNDIFQGNQGYMWFATLDGISKFNGTKFFNYSTEHGISDKSVRNIYQAVDSTVWIATDRGLNTYRFGQIAVVDSEKGFPNETPCWVITGDRNGTVWIGTVGKGLFKFSNGVFTNYTTENGLPDNTIRSLEVDKSGNLWIGMKSAVTFFNGVKFKNYSVKDGLPDATARCIKSAPDGKIWFATAGEGVFYFYKEKFYSLKQKDGLINNTAYALEIDRLGNIWIGTLDGVSKYNGNYFTNFTTVSGLSAPIVLTIFKDRENNLWFGTRDGGVNKLASEKFATYDESVGLINNAPYAIAENGSGEIFVGTGEGLSIISRNGIKNFTKENGLPANSIPAITTATDGSVWIATFKGAVKYSNGKFTKYSKSNGFTNDVIGAIFRDRNGNIWLGTDAEGVYKFDGKSFKNFSEKDGLIDNTIYGITQDKQGNIWFAGYNKGICRFDGNRFYDFPEVNQKLAQAKVYTISASNDGRIWIGTQNSGFFIYEKGKFTQYTTDNGLSNNVCYFFIHDDDGNTWIGTNRGLNKFDGTSFKMYDVKSGIVTNEFNVGAGFKDSKGYLWLGTVKGLVRFDPKLDKKNDIPPPIYLTSVKIFEDDTTFNKHLELSYTENYLKFEWKGLSYTSPDDILYQYKLSGVDPDWQLSNSTTIQYTSLRSGEYEFLVKAANSDMVWSVFPAKISFEILPPWWETWWFRITALVLLISGGYTFYVVKTYRLKQRSIELARLVKERTRELEEEKDKSDELIHNILPAQIVKELKEKGVTEPREFKLISILFTDFKGFTSFSSKLPPNELVAELNDIFNHFDRIIDKYELEKLKTIGDSYMIGGGLPTETDDHAVRIILAALELQSFMHERNKQHQFNWQMRAGVHSGNVVAGVVGKRKFTYDIWGDTVNTASRMESNGEPGKINVSEATQSLVANYFEFEERGKIAAKGKGEIDMFFVSAVKKKALEEYSFAEISDEIIKII